MVQYIPSLDYRGLLPPLLACLPTSFVSPRPPPALLPLLTPILRQRVQLLTATASSPTDSWLPLLCWETEPAQKLVDIISGSDAFELHPVSGEIDFGEVERVQFRRLDEETLQAKVVLTEMGLVVIYLWCVGDSDGGGDGWHVSELRPSEGDDLHGPETWWPSMAQADEKSQDMMMTEALRQGHEHSMTEDSADTVPAIARKDEDEDDDYWALYDQTPGGRSPVANSPGPSVNSNARAKTTSDADYYARYAQVQPEMDNDHPLDDSGSFDETALNGNAMTSPIDEGRPPEWAPVQGNVVGSANGAGQSGLDLNHPRASSPRARSNTITCLEQSAECQSMAEVAVKQHISTSIKSLFRLSRNSGIERSDFVQMVHTELETLSMIADDD